MAFLGTLKDLRLAKRKKTAGGKNGKDKASCRRFIMMAVRLTVQLAGWKRLSRRHAKLSRIKLLILS